MDFKVADATVSGLRMTALPLAPVEVVIHKLFTAKTNEQPDRRGQSRAFNLQLMPVERKPGGLRR